jgi:hypothetical protein
MHHVSGNILSNLSNTNKQNPRLKNILSKAFYQLNGSIRKGGGTVSKCSFLHHTLVGKENRMHQTMQKGACKL